MSPRKYEHPATEDVEFVRVLAAVSDPIRLEMVKRLADGKEHDSLTLAKTPLSCREPQTRSR